MKAVREGPVMILPRPDGKTIDLFTGKGWDKHTVFEVGEGKKLRLIKGVALADSEFKYFKSKL